MQRSLKQTDFPSVRPQEWNQASCLDKASQVFHEHREPVSMKKAGHVWALHLPMSPNLPLLPGPALTC